MAKKNENFSILDSGLTVEGSLSCTGKILIKGTVKGTLDGQFITVGEEGTVCADTKADHITVGGRFEGDLEVSDKLVVLATGRCEGDVKCKDLIVEQGGVLNAKVTRISVPEPSPAKKKFIPFKKSGAKA